MHVTCFDFPFLLVHFRSCYNLKITLVLVVFLIFSFNVQDAPAIVESHYDVRIVGCSGGVGGKHLGFK